jgi:hypothetical protein
MKNGMIFPFKTTWRSRLDLEYLDETSGRKIAARIDQSQSEDQADHTAVGKKLKQFTDYASKETMGQVHAGGFLHHRIILNPDGSKTSPLGLNNAERKKRICDAWIGHLNKFKSSSANPVIQHRLIFTMSGEFHDKLVDAGINPDIVLRSSLKSVLNRFQQRFHPRDSIGYAYGFHHDTDNLHAHVAICPRTAKGVYVGVSMSRTRESGNKNQMTYLMRAFEQENRRWEKLLADPEKLKQTLGKRLDADKISSLPKITAQQMEALRREQSLYATRLRHAYQSIQKMEAQLLQRRQAIRTIRLFRHVPKLFGRRKQRPVRTIEKVAGVIEKYSIREMQSLLYRMKQSYREDHRIYSQRYGFTTNQKHTHANRRTQLQSQGQRQIF